MISSNYLTIAASTVLVTACSTNNVHKNNEIAETGLIYVEKVDKLLGETLKLVYEVDANELEHNRPDKDKNKKSMLSGKTKVTLKLENQLLEASKNNTNTKRYFQALQALINNPNRDSMSHAIGDISTTIARENHRQKYKLHDYAPSYQNESYLRQLSSMAANAHYAKKIQIILHRDKDIIGQHLTLQKRQLKYIVSTYKRHIETAQRLYFKKNVQDPYLRSQNLAGWVSSRLHWFEMRQPALDFDELLDAHRNVKKAWARLFQGNGNATSVSHMLSDTNQLIDTVSNTHSPSETVSPTLINLNNTDMP